MNFIDDTKHTRQCYNTNFIEIKNMLNEKINIDSIEDRKAQIKAHLQEYLKNDSNFDFDVLTHEFYEELYEYSVITPYMKMGDENKITDFFIDGFNDISYRNLEGRLIDTGVSFFNEAHLKTVIDKIIDSNKSDLNKSSMTLESTFANGARLTGQHPIINVNGFSLAIRFKAPKIFTETDYLRFGSCSKEMIDFYKFITRIGARVMIHGITGSGKTSLLESLIRMYPRDSTGRSVHRHGFVTDNEIVYLRKRDPLLRVLEINSVKKGEHQFSLSDAVKNALRMDIKKLHFNEIRDVEVYDVFKGWTTGHDGISGCFGENVLDAWNGLSLNLKAYNNNFSDQYCAQLIDKAVDVFIECKQVGKKKVHNAVRQLVGIDEFNRPILETLFEYNESRNEFISHLDNIELSEKLKIKELGGIGGVNHE